MDYQLYINKSISKIGKLAYGKEFTLRDLFEGTEWNDLRKGERLNLGRQFKHEVESDHIPEVKYYGKAQNNSAKYRKEI